MVAVMLAGGGYYGMKRPEAPKTYDTAIGETRRLAMEDGSVVEMNTNSEVNVAYSDHSRDIYLAHGEGNFTVAKNKSRPFIVHAGDTTVTAVGTAFSVDATRPDQLRVAVSEGTVAVRHGAREPAYVTAMQVLTVPTGEQQKEEAPQLVVATAEQIDKHLAWRKGMLVFSGESLSEAAAQFNRYNQRQISVTPRAAAAAQRVGGVFQTRDVEGFAHATAASFGLTVNQDKNGNMVIDKGS
jgi:transmembrane sensor